jgi:toxin ParE1/3/4
MPIFGCAYAPRFTAYPESYPVVTRHLRRALIDRFPFAIFYLTDAEVIQVFAVLHTSRDPQIWQMLN